MKPCAEPSSPSPPAAGGEGRGEEGLSSWLASLIRHAPGTSTSLSRRLPRSGALAMYGVECGRGRMQARVFRAPFLFPPFQPMNIRARLRYREYFHSNPR